MHVSHALARVFAVLCLVGLVSTPAAAEGKKGLGALFRASTKAPTTITPEPESGPQSAGLVAKSCGMRGKALGKVVEKGPGGWKLYDTAPGATSVRDFYLTGFSDGCPRRISGAVAMFGSVELYELVHYGPVGMTPGTAETDRTYARLRSRVCGSSKSACSEREVKKLSKQAVFVDVYKSAANKSRLQLLMNRGKVAAVSQK